MKQSKLSLLPLHYPHETKIRMICLELIRSLRIAKGLDWYSLLEHPFAKAAYIMFMISEVHPFPTVYREDYMGSLKKLTRQRDADAYIRMLLRAWKLSSYVHDESLDGMERYLTACNAFLTYKEGYLKILPGEKTN